MHEKIDLNEHVQNYPWKGNCDHEQILGKSAKLILFNYGTDLQKF